MLKIWMAVLLLGSVIFLGLSPAQAIEDEPMSNSRFADILIGILEIEMPFDADILSDAELFELQGNMLSERGINLFVDADPDTLVNKCDLANVLYDALVGPNNVAVDEKIDHLAGLNYLSQGTTCDTMGSDEIITALNIPKLSTAVAEAYSLPGGPGARLAGVTVAGAGILMAPAPESNLDN
ncbi:MAG: hypothetical protein U9R31_04080 [Candidatus Omnitrophota bacterium]|nr:hypothetical protein [Candidatus Omnitrophota bacterium]